MTQTYNHRSTALTDLHPSPVMMKTRHYTEEKFLDGPEKRNHLDGSLASAFIEPK